MDCMRVWYNQDIKPIVYPKNIFADILKKKHLKILFVSSAMKK